MLDSEFIRNLKKICGSESVLDDPVSLCGYENDAIRFKRHVPQCVVIPSDRAEFIDVIRLCIRYPFPYTIRGAGTSLSGGPLAVQGGVIIHVSRLNKIEEINSEDMYCVAEPGVVINQLNNSLKSRGLFYPPDPSSGVSCTLGGNIAENAGGIRCFKYGVTSNYVLGLEVITTDGEVIVLGGPAGGAGTANGCSWQHLITGSEGTLAAVSRIWLRLLPFPGKVWTFLAEFSSSAAAMSAVTELTRCPVVPTAIEFIENRIVELVEKSPFAVGLNTESCYLLAEIDGPDEIVDLRSDIIERLLKTCGAEDVKKSCDEKERLDLWKARKVFGGLLGQISPDNMSQDAVVPSSKINEVLEYIYREADLEGITAVSVVHAGDGNMHPNFLFDAGKPGDLEKVEKLSRKLMEKVISCGGSLSGEHGIGTDKLAYMNLMFSPMDREFQLAAAKCFNPDHKLNPGKIFIEREYRVSGSF